jgi:hypothetical protein
MAERPEIRSEKKQKLIDVLNSWFPGSGYKFLYEPKSNQLSISFLTTNGSHDQAIITISPNTTKSDIEAAINTAKSKTS